MEKYTNNAGSTLNGGISNSVTSLIVTDASTFPTSGNFRILIDSEILKVTAVSGTTFTAIRGQEGTSASAHSNGAAVDGILTKGALDAIRGDDVVNDTWANRPTSAINGRLFLPSDSMQLSFDNGSGWANWGIINQVTEPPTSGWTWYDNTNANTNDQFTTSSTNGGVYFDAPVGTTTSNNRAIYYRTYPTPPFTLTVGILPNWCPRFDQTDVVRFGIGILDAANHSVTFDINCWSSPLLPRIQVLAWGHVQGASATGVKTVTNGSITGPFWMQLNDDNTNRHWKISLDGINYSTFYSEGRTVNVTPTRIGMFIGSDSETAGYGYGMTLFSWAGVA